MNIVTQRVADFIKKYKLQDKTIVVGFSGGYDSMCLLNILAELKNLPEFDDMTVIAAHFNHNWRGEESLREQEICRIFANSKGFEFYLKQAPNDLKKTENDARIARYEFFEEAYEEFDADAVFTAHNKDDNAETVLYRIIKGTGIVGLKGISEKRNYFYRPLLTTRRSEIVAYCTENNLSPNNDSSNSNTAYKRNYIRLNVVPALEKINAGVKDALNILSYNAINDNEIIEEYLKTIRPQVFNGDSIKSEQYSKLSKQVKLRLLHEFIQKLDLDYDYKKINEIYEFIEENITQKNGSTKSLATALWLYADEKIVETIPKKSQNNSNQDMGTILISGEGEYKFNNKTLTIKKYIDKDLFVFPEATSNFAYVDFSCAKFPLTLRTRRDGDIISPFGMTGTMKLKKYMNSKGVARHNRDEILLLCDDKEVLWVLGVGISSKIGVKSKPTHVLEVN
mgnify:CR=1 FL=1